MMVIGQVPRDLSELKDSHANYEHVREALLSVWLICAAESVSVTEVVHGGVQLPGHTTTIKKTPDLVTFFLGVLFLGSGKTTEAGGETEEACRRCCPPRRQECRWVGVRFSLCKRL